MKDILARSFERIDEPELNRRIVLLWLEKFEVMTALERETIRKVVDLISHPMFISK